MRRLKQAFIPSAKNDYMPDMLQRTALILMGGLIVISFTTSNLLALFWQQSSWLVGAVLPAVVVEETNHMRENAALPELVRSEVLDAAARLKAEHMAAEGYFAHYSPKGVSPWYWFNQVAYPFVHAGENLAVHFTDSTEVVDAWMNSPTHRANIVNGNYTEIGVGTAKGRFEGYDTVFVVQLFGTRAVATAPLAPIVVSSPVSEPVAILAVAEESPDTIIDEEVAGVSIDVAADEPEQPSETSSPLSPIAVYAQPELTPIVHDNATLALVSDTISTSTDKEPAKAEEMTPTEVPFMVSMAAALTNPTSLLQKIYLIVGLVVIIGLFLSVCIEWRHKRSIQVLYGVGLLVLMCALFLIHVLVSQGVTVV